MVNRGYGILHFSLFRKLTMMFRLIRLLIITLRFSCTLSLRKCDTSVQATLTLKFLYVPVKLRLVPDVLIPLGSLGAEIQNFLDQLCVFYVRV